MVNNMRGAMWLCVFVVPMAVSPVSKASEQSDESFAAAFQVMSSSPPYVRVTVINELASESRTYCVTSNILLGAIDKERQLNGQSRAPGDARKIVLSAPGHVFRFKQQAAMDYIPKRYSDEDLEEVRTALDAFATEDLGKIGANRLQLLIPGRHYWDVRDALACGLIERGLSPVMQDITGQVGLARPR
ncbi:hypothetical protein SNE35_00275 [Paucibacter sp. R3-3]|uniref:Uncharacterized protein n=1 Tax=Roseateles agri TaxID=3098619 RepID=A0ABU5D9F6_9BURK|nr:hypothetical protein [Paucibacter sp. R3-3]MDY0742913.1 hypothetical protein [Paucibacter sp. R3-3]